MVVDGLIGTRWGIEKGGGVVAAFWGSTLATSPPLLKSRTDFPINFLSKK